MAEVKKKPAVKKAAVKKAAVKKAAQEPDLTEQVMDPPTPEEKPEEEAPLAAADVQAMINDSLAPIADGMAKLMQAVTAQATAGDKPAVEGDDDVDLEILELTDPIGAQLAKEDRGPGGKTIEADPLHTTTLTKEQIESMSDEEIDAFNQNEQRKMAARKQQQIVNRSKLERMSTAERVRYLTRKRDPDIIREADNPLGERMVQCVAIRRVGLGEQGTSDVNETIKIPLSGARYLQDQGAIKVTI